VLKRLLIGVSLPLVSGFGVSHAADLSFNLNVVGEVRPGVYGRVEVGNAPPPPVVYAQPMIIAPPPPQAVPLQPVYLHVPPEHARDWNKHCQRYHACNRPVYFVKSEEYQPGYREREARRLRELQEHERHDEHERHEEHERHDEYERHEGR
jgi:hypothetical protein